MKTIIQAFIIICATSSLSACVFATGNTSEAENISNVSKQALATCGSGNVDKVTASSFTCKTGK
jgi:hypothetical protein